MSPIEAVALVGRTVIISYIGVLCQDTVGPLTPGDGILCC